jgi:alkanesulfonate monooxygenase SsuD/methylene tetrahydromethanopterin reductase-like flavin-dependent oxidoreductase (luciferase family)
MRARRRAGDPATYVSWPGRIGCTTFTATGRLSADGRCAAERDWVGVLRVVVVADTDAEALELWTRGAVFCGAAWFAPFHFGDLLVAPGSAVRPKPLQMIEDGMLVECALSQWLTANRHHSVSRRP